jgi:hypothetical protein
MAANLAGMFQQLNSSINANPMAQGGVGQGLFDSAGANVGNLLGGAMGTDPYSFMTDASKQIQGKQDLGGIGDMSTAAGMQEAAGIYGKMGQVENQMAMAQAAEKKQASDLLFKQTEAAKQSLADRAEKLDMAPLATTIRSGGHPDLKDAAKTIREEEQRVKLLKMGEPGRRVMARQAGFTDEEYQKDLKGLTDEQLTKVVSGEEGTTKAYMDADGKEVILGTDKYGRVWIDGKRMRPDEAGLKQAPKKTQEVLNAADVMVTSMNELAAEDFKQLHEGAKDAARTIETTDRAVDRLNAGMASGVFAPIEIALGRVASELGIAPEWAADAQNAQAYAATMGNEVATVIKEFGSGTGLSDADREYALLIAGGDVKVDEATLRWLLNARRLAAKNILGMHGEILTDLSNQGMDPTAFKILDRTTTPGNTTPSEGPGGPAGLSENSMKYFGTPR